MSILIGCKIMRLVKTRALQQGSILAKPIYSENGQILIQNGMRLTLTMINRLIKNSITYVYIADQALNHIEANSGISNQLRVRATYMIKEAFKELKLKSFTEKSYILERKGNELTTVVKDIISEVKNSDEAVTLLTDILISDDYIFQHSINVTIYALALGTKLKLTDHELVELGMGAILHDIGKIFICPKILQKTSKLTDEEFDIMKTHTKLGFDFIRKWTDLPAVIAHCAYQHHERLDGSGYPRGLRDKDIHKYAKIIGIADVFDAVTSNRIYREAMLPHVALEILYAGALNKFDKDMVRLFKDGIVVYPNGLIVELSDGSTGVVTKQNPSICDRPIIEVIRKKQVKLSASYEINLGKRNDLTITKCFAE